MALQRADNWKRPFFTIWTGQALSLTGSRIAMFALIWWLTEKTGSATVLATATLFAMLPQIVLGPLVGVYVDRWNRRITMIVADSLIALAALGLAYLFWSGQIELWHVYAIMLFREIGGTFHWPAMQASTSLMVPDEHLARVSGVNQAMMGALNIVGPALGALLLSIAAMHYIMLLDVATAILATTPLYFVRIPQPERTLNGKAPGEKTSVRDDLREGLRYLLNWRGLLLLTMGVMVFKIALTPAFSLLPLLVTDHFGGKAGELATLESAFGIGVILGGLLLGVWGGFKRNMLTTMLGVSMIGLMLILVGLIPANLFAVAVVLMFINGSSVALTDGPLIAILQKTIAPEMQGRIFMLIGSLFSITSPIGLLFAGPITDWIGIQTWYVVAGLLISGFAVWAACTPAIMRIEDYVYEPAPADSRESDDSVPAGQTPPLPRREAAGGP
ncbi:MAG: MFS transporter [Chloroflexi bacterium]|nr:MAG: MFS transporter [Chloroflexota bacterium]